MLLLLLRHSVFCDVSGAHLADVSHDGDLSQPFIIVCRRDHSSLSAKVLVLLRIGV